jgi:hypothetical protein
MECLCGTWWTNNPGSEGQTGSRTQQPMLAIERFLNTSDGGIRVGREHRIFHLSRSPKVLQQLSEPEVFGCHAGLATRLLWRQRQNPGCGIGGQGIDGRGLPVGRYQPLEFAPELIHRAQFRRLPGQPHEADPQPVRQRLGLRGGVGAGSVGQ